MMTTEMEPVRLRTKTTYDYPALARDAKLIMAQGRAPFISMTDEDRVVDFRSGLHRFGLSIRKVCTHGTRFWVGCIVVRIKGGDHVGADSV